MVITSKENETVKHIKKLKDKKYRDESNKYIVEGLKLVKEAMITNSKIETIIICDSCEIDEKYEQKFLYDIAKYNCIYVAEKIFNTLTEVVNSQGIFAVIEKNDKEKIIDYNEDIIVALDSVQDPGNLGTILRTLDSIGIKQVVLSKSCVDPYNSKVVRSTMGAIFRINMIRVDDLVISLKEIKKHKFKIMTTALETDKLIYDVKYEKTVIVIGNEANGVSREVLDMSDTKIKIPMLGQAESLNASVATGIVLYEYVRQKLLH